MKISFEQFEEICYHLLSIIDKTKDYNGIVCPLYGGFYLADFLRRNLKLELHLIRLQSYNESKEQKSLRVIGAIPKLEDGNYLLVDDIIDSGKTVNWIKTNYKKCKFDCIVMVSKQHRDDIIWSRFDDSNDWVQFPWENK